MWWLTIPVIIYSAGIFLLWLILRRCSGRAATNDGGRAKVTVVVAAHNEEKEITALLESLNAQDYPRDLLEVIIVNDNSTDRTPMVVSEYIGSECASLNIKLIYSLLAGKKNAIRQGVRKAAGELIITTDADCTVGPHWVSSHALIYGQGGIDMVLGEVYQVPGRSLASHFGVFEFSALQAITESAVMAGHPVMCNAANMSFRREIYLSHAGEVRPDIPSGDDMFLLHAVLRAGGVIRYAGSSGAAVETASAVTAAALLRQRARWASKTIHYSDAATLTLAAATAACNAAVTAAAVAAVVSPGHLPVLAALYGIRVLPDYLITAYKIKKRGAKMPLIPFLISEVIYPFYFVTVAVIGLLPSSRKFSKR